MVEKMYFVNMTGPIKMLETSVIQNVVPHEIQLVNANNILATVKGIRRFDDTNPYKGLMDKVIKLGEVAEINFVYDEEAPTLMTPTSLLEPEIDGYERQLGTIQHISNSLKEEKAYRVQLRNQIEPIKNLKVEIQSFFDFDYMKFRFGSMPRDSFEKLNAYIEQMDCIVYEISREDDEVYLVYFMPRSKRVDIDNLFASMFFKRIRISSDIQGYPMEALEQLNEGIDELTERIRKLEEESRAYVKKNLHRLDELYTFVAQLDSVFDVRNLAVRSDDAFFLTGWIAESKLNNFKDDMDEMPLMTYVIEEDEDIKVTKPPTKLRNPSFFKPFESLVKMYGTPSYSEMDPTIFIGITYLLFFGIMFGDVGQGIIISLVGWLLYKKTGNSLGKMGVYLGVASIVFGFVYGSIFGNEEVLGELLGYNPVRPMNVMMEILVVTVIYGVFLIIVAMLINVKNIYKKKDIGKLFTDKNGLAGLIFYITVLSVLLAIYFEIKINMVLVIVFISAPLILIFMGHPLESYINHRKLNLPKDKGGFIVESIFELIETLLGFFSNTISFIRIGAFALNHVGFFLAFHMLSEIVGESSGSVGKAIVMIFGNILIIVLEGLIVGIQGMRLTFYELFSRFFEGEGSDFKPFSIKK